MRAVVVIAWVVAAMPARAESTATQVRFVEVIAAILRAPSMQVSRYEIASAEARVDAARAWPSPSIHAQTNRVTARVVGGVTLPLPIFGTIDAARQVAAAQRDAVLASAILNDRDVVRRAAIGWIALARADAEVVDARTTEVLKSIVPLATAVIGGLELATIVTLVVTPGLAAQHGIHEEEHTHASTP